MVGIVIVSHSASLAEGVRDLAAQMAPDYDGFFCAGGLFDGSLGTDATRILEGIQTVNTGDGVAVFCDLGSAILSAETAIDLLEEPISVRLADAPLVEGVMVAAVEASAGEPLEQVIAAAEETWSSRKL
mgnify:CR=1 FL=1